LDAEVSTEESVRAAADTSLTTRVSTEESTRLAADDSLESFISGEISLVEGKISTETSRAESTEDSLESLISTEVSTLNDTIASEISTEASTRLSADESLSTAISAINADEFGRVGSSPAPDGVQTQFDLDSELKIDTEFVYLNGVLQEKGGLADYTVVTDPGDSTRIIAINFNSAPEATDKLAFAGNILA
jgi:hypothetical protein